MGWLIRNHIPSCIRDEIARLCTWDTEDGRGYPVLISRKGTVWYAAVRSEPAAGRLDSGTDASGSFQTDATGGYVFAAIFLTSTKGGEWGYKDMDETMGPADTAAHAPEKLLSLLSVTTNDYATDWRQRCRDHAAKERRPLKPGDVIRLAEPLRFTDGAELQTFRVGKIRHGRRNRTVFISTENGGQYRISNIKSRDWTRI